MVDNVSVEQVVVKVAVNFVKQNDLGVENILVKIEDVFRTKIVEITKVHFDVEKV